MFDPKIPYNELPLLPGNFDYNQVDILKATIKANKNLAKLNGLAQLLPNAKLLMAPLLIKESVESSAIENIHTTTQKVLQEEAIGSELLRGPEKEVLYYRKALIFGIKKIQEYGGIPTNLLTEIQTILEPTKQGIRKIPGTVIANDKTGEIIYTPPEGEQMIRDKLSNLEIFINTIEDDIDPLIKLGSIHYQFEAIHPFYDGNGRTGRMLMILYLMFSEKLDYPVLFISEYINRTRSQYYELLNLTSKTGDYKPIILYMLEAISEQALITEAKIMKIKELMVTIEGKLKGHSSLDYHQITTILFSNPYITMSGFAEKMGVVRQTVNRYVKQLEALKIIRTEKVGTNKLIYLPEFISLLS